MESIRFDAFFNRVNDAIGLESQQELASLLGVNRSAITQAKRRDSIPEKWILKLSREYGLSPDWLEKGVGNRHLAAAAPVLATLPQESEFHKVPKVSARLCAGGGSFEVGAEVKEYQPFDRQWLQRKGTPDSMVLMDVFGASMEPEIKEGDTVLVDQSHNHVIAGAIYAVGVEDTVMVKRIEKRPSALVLLSDNVDYSPIVLQGDELNTVRVIGKVVWICREYR